MARNSQKTTPDDLLRLSELAQTLDSNGVVIEGEKPSSAIRRIIRRIEDLLLTIDRQRAEIRRLRDALHSRQTDSANWPKNR